MGEQVIDAVTLAQRQADALERDRHLVGVHGVAQRVDRARQRDRRVIGGERTGAQRLGEELVEIAAGEIAPVDRPQAAAVAQSFVAQAPFLVPHLIERQILREPHQLLAIRVGARGEPAPALRTAPPLQQSALRDRFHNGIGPRIEFHGSRL
jgi:hypothetical protein